MPKYEVENWGDIANTIFAKGVITAVNSEDDTADVTVEGYQDGSAIPLFYHCEPDSEEAANGSIEGAASGFSVDDEVIVMCTADGEPVRIIGFVDGIKSCIWEPWNTDPNDEYNFATTNPWEISYITPDIPAGRQPFEMVDGSLVYSVHTGSISEESGTANDGLKLDMRTENTEFRIIAPTELYIKIACSVSGPIAGHSEFYNYLFLFGANYKRLFIYFNSISAIYPEWIIGGLNSYISLPTSTSSFWNVENDGTIPIPLTPLDEGEDITYLSIETGYDYDIMSTFSIDFINFK